MKKNLLLTLPLIAMTFASCGEDPQAKKEAEARALAQLKVRMTAVAQEAADRGLIGGPVCVSLGGEGRTYSAADADILPEAALWRFFEREGLAVRRIASQKNGSQTAAFYLRDLYRNNYAKEQYCFGRWAIVDITPTAKGKSEKRHGVTMYPFDITLRLTKLRSQAWIDNSILESNLTGGLKTISQDRKVRGYLPASIPELPPTVTKRLDQ